MEKNEIEFDVIVVGLGPTGLIATGMLAQRGIKVANIERHEKLYGLPRAGHYDHEMIRFLQELGVEKPFLDDAFETSSYRWYNGEGKILLDLPWGGWAPSGYNSDYMAFQPVLEDAIFSAIEREAEHATLYRGWEITDVTQDENGVTASIRRVKPDDHGGLIATGEEKTVRGKYLLAADGARSVVRTRLGIGREDQGFNESWLDVDVRVKRPLPRMDPHQICDPKRPIFISPLGKRHHRFEWCVLPGENREDFGKPARAWELLAEQNVGPDDVEIVRQLVYTFEARVAHRWREKRIFLVGDAAHTMPPFMGQGACSGMRDSVNLAWKLDLVLSGKAPETLLDSYQIERQPHTQTWIDLSIYTGQVACTLDPKLAAERDAKLLSGEAPPPPKFPDLANGLIDFKSEGEPPAPIGQWFPQYEVSANGQSGLFDNIAGRGFFVATLENAPAESLSAADQAFLKNINAKCITIARAGETAPGAITDSTGSYARYFAEQNFEAIIVRPDYYIYGVARHKADLPALIARLKSDLNRQWAPKNAQRAQVA